VLQRLSFVPLRIVQAVPVVFGVTIVVFFLVRLLPGGPAVALLGEHATPEAVAAVNRQYGLDGPIWVQYLDFLKHIVTGNLGTSLFYQQPVSQLVRVAFPATLQLVLYAIVLVFPFLYALSPLTSDSAEPRYTVILSPVLALLVAQLATVYRRSLLVLLAGCAVSFVVVDRMNTYVRTTPAAYPTAPRDLRPLIATLDRLHLSHVYADYWLAYYIDFLTRERMIFASDTPQRILFYNQLVAEHASTAVRLSRRRCDGGVQLVAGVYRCP